MRSARMVACAMGLFALLLLSSSAVRCEEAEEGPGLAAAKEELAALLPLTIANGRLVLNREAWEKPAEKNAAKKDEDAEEGGQVAIGGNAAGFRIRRMIGGGNLPTPAKLFQAYMQKASGGVRGANSSMSGTGVTLKQDGQNLTGALSYDKAQGEFTVKLVEKVGDGRLLSVEDDEQTGLTVRLSNPAAKTSLLLVQSTQGPVSLVCFRGKESTVVGAEDFATLLRQEPSKVQTLVFRPLRALGIEPPLNPYYPPVMAAACTAFSPPAAETTQKVDALIKKLADDDMDVRDKATQDLTELFPLAIRYVSEAAEKTQDPEAKTRLQRVVAAHPGIGKAKAYALEHKLHEDKAYLLEIMGSAPFFKTAARVRLSELYGKDFGEDPRAWPAPPKPEAPAKPAEPAKEKST
jgi:hypothetical protein